MTTSAGRRRFILIAATATGGGALLALRPLRRTTPAPGATAPVGEDTGYRLTEHIRTYYRSTRY